MYLQKRIHTSKILWFLQNIYECLDASLKDCHENGLVQDTNGSYQCLCLPGWTGDGTNSADINECDVNADEFVLDATYLKNYGPYDCECNTGFASQDGFGRICDDIDERTVGGHGFHDVAIYSNVSGSWSCDCDAGYDGDGTIDFD